MAQYTIVTTRTQEAALIFSFEHYNVGGLANKEQFLQQRVSAGVLDPMVAEQKRSNSVALNESILTVPDSNSAKAEEEIKAVILANGGSLVPPGASSVFIPPIQSIPEDTDASLDGGALHTDRGEDGDKL